MRSNWAAMILGLVLALIGLVLFIGGIWLAILGGSIYYLLAGLGLLASGYLLFCAHHGAKFKEKLAPTALAWHDETARLHEQPVD